jgi:hypothetical protein
MAEEFGIVAEEGFTYETKGAVLFREAEYNRKIKAKFQSIEIYDPKVDYASPAHFKIQDNPNPENEVVTTVPSGCRVVVIAAPVIGATAIFTRE